MAVAHGSIALWNLIIPTVGFIRGERPGATPSVAPVFLTGRAPGGHRWSGVGINVATF